ncbi:hypothetical protein GXB81_03685 [Paraburkholderia sp. Ac-20336]|uniref:hypothetical protein n=1 Tax=Paraburkholderia sp. Ac-20336 TaxID=2703886 RepID=UPI0019807E72|nr:hypothetical protein [Paraburkholderia sp. Ac-20336]MBN3802157.1 hypothetical protein [Paraburkholderia sp. Ac-20336]
MRYFSQKSDRQRLPGALSRLALIVVAILGATIGEPGIALKDDLDQGNLPGSVSDAPANFHNAGNLPERRFRRSRRASIDELQVQHCEPIREPDIASVAYPYLLTPSHRTSYGAGSTGVSALGDVAAQLRVDI